MRHHPAHVIDLVPTILELVGGKRAGLAGKPTPAPPGRSLVGAFAKDGVVEREYLWWLHEGNRALRSGRWKIVAGKGGEWELYDLKVDRGESNDLATKHVDRVKRMVKLWEGQFDQARALAQGE